MWHSQFDTQVLHLKGWRKRRLDLHLSCSASFDGVKEMMVVNHSPEMSSEKSLSLSFWIYLLEDSTDTWRTIFRKGASASDMTPTLSLFPDQRKLHTRVSVAGMDSAVVTGVDSVGVIPLRSWTHIGFCIQSTALHLYINSILDIKLNLDEGEVIFNAGPTYIGKDPFMSGTAMFIDELKIWNRYLPQNDMVVEATSALTPLGSLFMRLACLTCPKDESIHTCGSMAPDSYHLCTNEELMGGGLIFARRMGWLMGPSSEWNFWMASEIGSRIESTSNEHVDKRTGLCCQGDVL